MKFLFLIFLPLCIFQTSIAAECSSMLSKSKMPSLKKTIIADIPIKPVHRAKSQFFGDSKNLFISATGLFYRAHLTTSGSLQTQQLLALNGLENSIRNVTFFDQTLWILKDGIDPSEASSLPTFSPLFLSSQILKSTDGGQTFTALPMTEFRRSEDSPFGTFYEFAPVSQMEKMNIAGKQALVINAGVGPSLFTSFDNGISWKALSPEFGNWTTMGYEGSFEKVDNKIFFGGEHPLDVAYLNVANLASDGTLTPLIPVPLPSNIDNRRIQFIKRSPYLGNLLFAGVEGGLLVSRDQGLTWQFSFIEHDEAPNAGRERRHYPYISAILFPSPKHPEFIVVAGQGQKGLGTVLFSADAGNTWQDVSDDVVGDNEFIGLNQLEDGTILLATRKETNLNTLEYSDTSQVSILELEFQ